MNQKISGLKPTGAFAPVPAGFCACASTKVNNTESLLSSAGFHTQTPSSGRSGTQWDTHKRAAPYKLERDTINGKVLYLYADKKKGVVYIAGTKRINATAN